MLSQMIRSKTKKFNEKMTGAFSVREQRALLEKCAQTTLSSKLIARQREFFAKMVVDAVLMLDELLPLNMYVEKKTSMLLEIIKRIYLGLE